jgi:integrase
VGGSLSIWPSYLQADAAGPLPGPLIGEGPRGRQNGPGERCGRPGSRGCQARGNACRRYLGRLRSPLSGKACQHSAIRYSGQYQPGTRAHAGRMAWTLAAIDLEERRGRSYRQGHEARPVSRSYSVEGSEAIRKPAKEKSRDRVLDDAELKLTWKAANAAGGAAGALVQLLILSGARRNEVTELARNGITADSIELQGNRTKNGLPHTIPITPMVRRVLDALPSTGKFVLNDTDRPFGDHSGAKEKVTPAIRPWTLHDLRRSFASGLQRLGVAPHIVELALNHRSGTFSGVAGIYQRHRYAKEVREAFELWSQHIEALTTKKAAAA